MPIHQSPGVLANEVDLTGLVPSVSTSIAAIAGVFRWGPINKRIQVDSESNLARRFGKPTNHNAETWFSGANFLSYANALVVSRAANTTGIITVGSNTFLTTPTHTVTLQSANATATLANTTGLQVGMKVLAAAANVRVGATIASIVNSTAITFSSNSDVTGTGAMSVQFVSNSVVLSAVANVSGAVSNLANQVVLNDDDYARKDIDDLNNVTAGRSFDTNVLYVAKYAGEIGNSLRISVCDTANGFTETMNLASYGNGGATVSINVGSNSATVVVAYNHDGSDNTAAQTAVSTSTATFKGKLNITDYLQFGNTTIGFQSLKVTAIGNTTSNVNASVAAATFSLSFDDELRLIDDQAMTGSFVRFWEFFDLFDGAPGQSDYVLNYGNAAANDELHVVVVDEKGLFSGVPGEVLESYFRLSRARDAKGLDNESIYYKDVLNNKSEYVWWARDRSTSVSNTALNVETASNNNILSVQFGYGADGSDESSVAMSVLINAYNLFQSAEDSDISLILQGKARGGTHGGQLANHIIDNIAEVRKDCVVFISPDKADVVNNEGDEADDIVDFRNTLRSTSYGFLDSGYKYQYDRYNDVFRWIPLNGDMAGLAARTDLTNDPWWSFAGFNRGQIKNHIKLAWNPRKADRDTLYKNGINPVATFKGDGTVLYGDKTLLAKPSAFDRINVRRLFIVLRKAISRAAQYTLFEFNDEFTRSQFKNMIVPYLRDVQGRRGITDFMVVCDKTNNTGEVIDRNEFIGDIYIKPARSINFITLNFVAVRTDVSFSEVVGRF